MKNKDHQIQDEILINKLKFNNKKIWDDYNKSQIDKIILKKDEEIKQIKKVKHFKENLMYKAKIFNFEKDLERFYVTRFEKEKLRMKNNYDYIIKEIIVEKDNKYDELLSELKKEREFVKEYKNSFISLTDHEIILNKLKNDFEKEINIYKGKLETIHNRFDESQFTYLDNNKNRSSKTKCASVNKL